MPEKTTMQSPDGEIREVEATEAALVPLMVAGWKQVARPARQVKNETPVAPVKGE